MERQEQGKGRKNRAFMNQKQKGAAPEGVLGLYESPHAEAAWGAPGEATPITQAQACATKSARWHA